MRAGHREFKLSLQLVAKRVFDIAVSAIVLLVLSPLFLLASLVLKLETRGPIFSVKHVYCYNNQHLRLLRFRSRGQGFVSAFGRVLIRSGLDQLPMLINVLRGEMSIVGSHFYVLPPPQPYDQLPSALLHGPLKPGLVSFKGPHAGPELSPADADLAYISSWSFGLDLKILVHHLSSKDTYFQSRPNR
jgi:lipopolysaccharide/colanic/teichoic acid biosynthesis glycosyltransferase